MDKCRTSSYLFKQLFTFQEDDDTKSKQDGSGSMHHEEIEADDDWSELNKQCLDIGLIYSLFQIAKLFLTNTVGILNCATSSCVVYEIAASFLRQSTRYILTTLFTKKPWSLPI
ncbi:hypothetical protein CCR75_003944 [Bremia lactucae]|uniref:Uncharacterized protein n=1 Tax=Bremia lactucae TaxID=4779 RepID=A0A976FMG2_BRELC|nr:hypothetical protein CCR75_003944 [Bremia lactucae]